VRWLDRLLLFLGTCAVILNLLPLGARQWWILDLSAHFRVQYLAITGVLLALTALRRRWLASLALLAAGAVSAAPLWPYLPRPAQVPAPTASPLKVLSVNVSYLQFSSRRLLEIVAEESPDILLVLEYTPYAARVLADLDKQFANAYKRPAEGPYGIALWSRHELLSATTLRLGRVPAIDARIRGPAGTFTFLGVHLSAPTLRYRAAQRNVELEALAAHRANITGPLIVAGDFNTTPYSPFFKDWLTATGLTDSRRHRTLSASWPTSLPWLGIPIDHVVVSNDIGILDHRRLPNFNSDHYGIVAELNLRQGNP